MNLQMKRWMEEDLKEFKSYLDAFKKKQMRLVPLWMALCVAGMCALGIAAGADIGYVMHLHLPVGCGIALFVGLAYWFQNQTTSIGKLRKQYQKGLWLPEHAQDAFAEQMEEKKYEAWNFTQKGEKYPRRLLVGPKYWMYLFWGRCFYFQTADIEAVKIQRDQLDIRRRIGDTSFWKQTVSTVSIEISYYEGSESVRMKAPDLLLFDNMEQLTKAVQMIDRNCPELHIPELIQQS